MTFSLNRILNALGFLAVCILLLTGFYLQYMEGIQPCPLCIVQRLCFLMIAITCFIGYLWQPQKIAMKIFYSILIIVFSGLGIISAGRQLWLQSHPHQAASEFCVPGFEYMLTNFPFHEVLGFLFAGSGNCAEVTWTLFSLSIAAWALVAFIGFALLGFFQMFYTSRN